MKNIFHSAESLGAPHALLLLQREKKLLQWNYAQVAKPEKIFVFLLQAGKDAEVRLNPAERSCGTRSSEAETLEELKAAKRERKWCVRRAARRNHVSAPLRTCVCVCVCTLLVYSGKNQPCVINYQGKKHTFWYFSAV